MGENFRLAKEIARIAGKQHGSITREQLQRLGLDDAAIHRRARAGLLYRVHRGVYSVGRPPVAPLEKAAAAVLACGPRSALSHGSAMTLWGFWKRWDDPFDVTIAGDRRPKGINTYRSTTLLRRDVVLCDGIRVTSAARTLLDMAPRLPPKSLTRFINDGRLQESLTLDVLADVTARNQNHPGAPLLRPHATNRQNPTRSGGEDDFQTFCERYGLPTPLTNTKVFGFEVDAYFPEEQLVVELDGWPYHRSRQSFEDDRERDATLLMHRIPTVRITYKRLKQDPDREAARLHSILEDRGSA